MTKKPLGYEPVFTSSPVPIKPGLIERLRCFLGKWHSLLPFLPLLFLLPAVFVTTAALQERTNLRSQARKLPGKDLPKKQISPPAPEVPDVNNRRVLILNFDPLIDSDNCFVSNCWEEWNDALTLTNDYISDISSVTGGYLNYQIVDWQHLDVFPMKKDGFQYTDETYKNCILDPSNCHTPDDVDYNKILDDYDICARLNNNEFDELWLWGAPWFGYCESAMAGPGALWINCAPIEATACQKKLPIMGFSYERGVAEMLEDMGHRFEAMMMYAWGEEPTSEPYPHTTPWGEFAMWYQTYPGHAGCGWSHYAPNSENDYDWANYQMVHSHCNDWLNYPNLTGAREELNCTTWGCDSRPWFNWWMSHIPKTNGRSYGKWNNWWRYVRDWDEANKLVSSGVVDNFYLGGGGNTKGGDKLKQGGKVLPGGRVEDNSCQVTGWACDPDSYDREIEVRLFNEVNGSLIASAIANQWRDDSECEEYDNRGFVFDIPFDSPLRDGNDHPLLAKAVDVDEWGNQTGILFDLDQTPKVLNCAPTLSLNNIFVSPNSGDSPLSDVDVTAVVGGSATGDIHYWFDCTNNGGSEYDVVSTDPNYTAFDVCDYPSPGTYTIKVNADRGGMTATSYATVAVTIPLFTLTVSAAPNSDYPPLENVDITAEVGGDALPREPQIHYWFDCTNNGGSEYDVVSTNVTYTAMDLCDYPDPGTYTVRVNADLEGTTLTSYATITVLVSECPEGYSMYCNVNGFCPPGEINIGRCPANFGARCCRPD